MTCEDRACKHNMTGVCSLSILMNFTDSTYTCRREPEPDTRPDHFYMVWSPNGTSPTVQHRTQKEALTEATRLAEKHPNRSFFILKALSVVKTDKPKAVVQNLKEVNSDENS